MIYVIILLAFALFFLALPPLSSPPSVSLFPHCVHSCNCVLHKGIRSALMRNCNCFFQPCFMDMFTCVDILWATHTDNMCWMNECVLFKAKRKKKKIAVLKWFFPPLLHIWGVLVWASRRKKNIFILSKKRGCWWVMKPAFNDENLQTFG